MRGSFMRKNKIFLHIELSRSLHGLYRQQLQAGCRQSMKRSRNFRSRLPPDPGSLPEQHCRLPGPARPPVKKGEWGEVDLTQTVQEPPSQCHRPIFACRTTLKEQAKEDVVQPLAWGSLARDLSKLSSGSECWLIIMAPPAGQGLEKRNRGPDTNQLKSA